MFWFGDFEMSAMNQLNNETISLAAAANQLLTNINVIRRWTSLGYIPTVEQQGETRIPREPFEATQKAISEWLRENFEPDEDGVIRASVQEMEEFWRMSHKS